MTTNYLSVNPTVNPNTKEVAKFAGSVVTASEIVGYFYPSIRIALAIGVVGLGAIKLGAKFIRDFTQQPLNEAHAKVLAKSVLNAESETLAAKLKAVETLRTNGSIDEEIAVAAKADKIAQKYADIAKHSTEPRLLRSAFETLLTEKGPLSPELPKIALAGALTESVTFMSDFSLVERGFLQKIFNAMPSMRLLINFMDQQVREKQLKIFGLTARSLQILARTDEEIAGFYSDDRIYARSDISTDVTNETILHVATCLCWKKLSNIFPELNTTLDLIINDLKSTDSELMNELREYPEDQWPEKILGLATEYMISNPALFSQLYPRLYNFYMHDFDSAITKYLISTIHAQLDSVDAQYH
ncbi:MAG: hypothetical protein HZB76_00155 [Chlamydiae bacterium]|nr:hypothetical protein [Chlamydiota bacterium]